MVAHVSWVPPWAHFCPIPNLPSWSSKTWFICSKSQQQCLLCTPLSLTTHHTKITNCSLVCCMWLSHGELCWSFCNCLRSWFCCSRESCTSWRVRPLNDFIYIWSYRTTTKDSLENNCIVSIEILYLATGTPLLPAACSPLLPAPRPQTCAGTAHFIQTPSDGMNSLVDGFFHLACFRG